MPSQLNSMTLYGQLSALSLMGHPEQQGGKSDNIYDLFHTYYTCSLRKDFVEAYTCYNALFNLITMNVLASICFKSCSGGVEENTGC